MTIGIEHCQFAPFFACTGRQVDEIDNPNPSGFGLVMNLIDLRHAKDNTMIVNCLGVFAFVAFDLEQANGANLVRPKVEFYRSC